MSPDDQGTDRLPRGGPPPQEGQPPDLRILFIRASASSSANTGKGDDKIIDIWGSDSGVVTRKRQRQRSEQRLHSSSKEGKHSLKILAGHSYNPSLEEHQDALAEVHHVVVIETSVLFSVQS